MPRLESLHGLSHAIAPDVLAKMGGDNPRDAAHALVGKCMSHIYHSNSCPETNEYASRVIGKVVQRRRKFILGESVNSSRGLNIGESESSGTSSGSSYSHSSGGGAGSGSSSGGSTWGRNESRGSSSGENRSRSNSENMSRGYSEAMDYLIEPGDFGRALET